MGKLFAVLAVRVTFIAVAVASVSMLVVIAIASTQPSLNPFTAYMDILPGHSGEIGLTLGFHCHHNIQIGFEETCVKSSETGMFSEIDIDISSETGNIKRVVFTLRDHILVLGNLVGFWGKPKLVVFGKTANFRWPKQHIVTVLQNYDGHFSYWLPITYIAFESAN